MEPNPGSREQTVNKKHPERSAEQAPKWGTKINTESIQQDEGRRAGA